MQGLRDVGSYIREQRKSARISLRQLADRAGVSNPYLSQIERGLRKPSAEILQQIAKALQISAEVLYVQAGILDERKGGPEVVGAVRTDGRLTERQKQVLLEIYESFCRESAQRPPAEAEPASPPTALSARREPSHPAAVAAEEATLAEAIPAPVTPMADHAAASRSRGPRRAAP